MNETLDQITRDNYRDYDAINYSKLSSLVEHPSKVHEEKDFSDGLRNGSLLDLFVYEGEDAVHEKYYVSSITQMPSDTIKEIIEAAPNYEDGTLIQTARDMDYGAKNWKDSTILDKITKNGGAEYMFELENAGDRDIISFEQFTEMQQAANLLKNHSFTSNFFTPYWETQVPKTAKLKDSEGNEHLFKGLLDGLLDETEYLIIQDLKYMSSPLRYFKSDFMSWKYYLQAALYSDIIEKEFNLPVKFYNVVYSSVDRAVQKFLVDESMISAGRDGAISYTGNKIKGYKQLAKELMWHEKHNKWDYPYEVYQNDGVETIEFTSYDS